MYADRHQLSGAGFSWVWTLSGLSFFVANWACGAWLARRGHSRTLLSGGLVAACAGAVAVFAWSPLPGMLLGTAMLAAGHAMVAAVVTTRLARTGDEARQAALALNGVAQSVGTFAGAGAASIGFALGGWPAVALTLAGITALAGAPLLAGRRAPRP